MVLIDDDPFAVFGDGDSDDEESHIPCESQLARIRDSFAERSNQSSANGTNGETARILYNETETFDVSNNNSVTLPWRDPLYLGPMILLENLSCFGGGRGYVATKDIPPGTLLLVEKPILAWQNSSGTTEFGWDMVESILLADDAQVMLYEMEQFHPSKDAVDANAGDDLFSQSYQQVHGMIKKLREQQDAPEALENCVQITKQRGLKNSNGTALAVNDFARLLLALRYNSLESGVYLHVAMLNHADQPTCVKFAPTNDKEYSEVRATRHIRTGEPLTISYVPHIISHASRRKHLYEQHLFDIGSTPGMLLEPMELVGGELPESTLLVGLTDDSLTCRIERTIADLRDLFRDAENNALEREHVKGLEQASLELYNHALEELNNDTHLLLIPCLELHLDCCDLIQHDELLELSQRMLLLSRIVDTALKLIRLQVSFHGPGHFALARTHLDLAQAVEELLSRSPRTLLQLKVDAVDSTSAWSTLAHKSRREHSRIKEMYPYDCEQWINKELS